MSLEKENFFRESYGDQSKINETEVISDTSISSLLNLLFFLFSSMKHVFRHFSCRARCETCSKLKTPEYTKLTIKLKIKTPLTSFWPLYC